MTNYDRVKEFVESNVDNNGILEMTYSEIATKMKSNVGIVSKHINSMLREGYLTSLRQAKRGRGNLPAKLKLESYGNRHNKRETVSVEVMGEVIVLVKSELGVLISKDDLQRITITSDHRTFDDIIQSNSRMFKENSTIIDDKLMLNAKAVMFMILKLDCDHCHHLRQQAIYETQNMVSEKMVDIVVRGRAILSEDEKIQLISNIEDVTQLDREDIISAFKNIETDVNNILNGYKIQLSNTRENVLRAEKETDRYKVLAETRNGVIDSLRAENTHLKLNRN